MQKVISLLVCPSNSVDRLKYLLSYCTSFNKHKCLSVLYVSLVILVNMLIYCLTLIRDKQILTSQF
jgi:hypothetical protein